MAFDETFGDIQTDARARDAATVAPAIVGGENLVQFVFRNAATVVGDCHHSVFTFSFTTYSNGALWVRILDGIGDDVVEDLAEQIRVSPNIRQPFQVALNDNII